MSGRVLGTAGHVDHGKSSLLAALTGMEPDRLPEERRRGMTIDLNFVWLDLPRGGRVGIVDVPGHHRFVKNMVGGASLVDAFLFVVAADDGWMPQSEEHLQVLRGLGVHRGLAVVTKGDLAGAARVRETALDVRRRLEAGLGRGVDVVEFSTARPQGALAVKAALDELVVGLPPPSTDGAPRVWIDRVFSPRGQGVVVTGTLREGRVREGDELRRWPSGAVVVVKTIERYRERVVEAEPVSRVALQLARVAATDLARGSLLLGGATEMSDRALARVRFWEAPSFRRGRVALSLHLGTARALVSAVELGPAREGHFLRLKLAAPLPLRSGDRFVLRTAGEERTVGAGEIADPVPSPGPRGVALEALQRWEAIASPAEAIVEYAVRRSFLVDGAGWVGRTCLPPAAVRAVLADGSRFRRLEGETFVPTATWDRAGSFLRRFVTEQSAARRGPVPEGTVLRALADALSMPQRPARLVLFAVAAAGVLRRDARGFLPLGPAPVDGREHARRERLRAAIAAGAGQPVNLKELLAGAAELKPSLWALVKSGEVVSLGEEHFLQRPSYESAVRRVRSHLRARGQAATPDLKGLLGASRRCAVLLLEQMDRERVTYLKEGVRRLLSGS